MNMVAAGVTLNPRQIYKLLPSWSLSAALLLIIRENKAIKNAVRVNSIKKAACLNTLEN